MSEDIHDHSADAPLVPAPAPAVPEPPPDPGRGQAAAPHAELKEVASALVSIAEHLTGAIEGISASLPQVSGLQFFARQARGKMAEIRTRLDTL